jgi:hypothetical protein
MIDVINVALTDAFEMIEISGKGVTHSSEVRRNSIERMQKPFTK